MYVVPVLFNKEYSVLLDSSWEKY